MNKKTKYTLIFILVITALYFAEKYIDKSKKEYPSISKNEVDSSISEFRVDFLPTSTTGVLVEHTYFALSYSESHEQAEWVAYELQKSHLSNNNFERPYFTEDRSIKSGSAHWRNYKNSGYDRGHLCPAGDRRFDYQAYLETFLTSNISPQDRGFNAGVWNSLEQKIRYWAERKNGVYIITGGVLKQDLPTIGSENVSVPEEFYKIVMDKTEEGYKVIAFLIPNQATQQSFYEFIVPIDLIEQKTGIDFLKILPDTIEDKLEASVSLKEWSK